MKTHYDVLNLEKNCSSQEIKDSFIKLSKQYHPDKNKSSDAHKKFVEVNEAYSVLGKSESRCKYDESLLVQKPRVTNYEYNSQFSGKTSYEEYYERYAANRRRYEGSKTYFTTSKLMATLFCCLLMVFGSGMHLIAESHRRTVRSQEIAGIFRDVQLHARRCGKQQILKEMQEKMRKNAERRPPH